MPSTCSFCVGVFVPIPTFPEFRIDIWFIWDDDVFKNISLPTLLKATSPPESFTVITPPPSLLTNLAILFVVPEFTSNL